METSNVEMLKVGADLVHGDTPTQEMLDQVNLEYDLSKEGIEEQFGSIEYVDKPNHSVDLAICGGNIGREVIMNTNGTAGVICTIVPDEELPVEVVSALVVIGNIAPQQMPKIVCDEEQLRKDFEGDELNTLPSDIQLNRNPILRPKLSIEEMKRIKDNKFKREVASLQWKGLAELKDQITFAPEPKRHFNMGKPKKKR